MSEAFRPIDVTRVRGRARASDIDRAATEEPLEIRLHGRSFAVIMRTPGADKELAAGFLLAERVLRTADDLGTIEYCIDKVAVKAATTTVGVDHAGASTVGATVIHERAENVINVTLVGRSIAEIDTLAMERRQTMTNSSCGLCGRQTIESLRVDVE